MHADARTRARGIDGAAHPGIGGRENESRKARRGRGGVRLELDPEGRLPDDHGGRHRTERIQHLQRASHRPAHVGRGNPGRAEEEAEDIHAREDAFDDRWGQSETPLAHRLQHVLDAVCEITHGRASDGIGRALEGVHGAEECRHFVRQTGRLACGSPFHAIGRGRLLEDEEGAGHGVEMLGRLGSEIGHRVRVLGEESVEVPEHAVDHTLVRARVSRPLRSGRGGQGRRTREVLGVARVKLGDDLRVLAAVRPDRIEHALDDAHHVAKGLGGSGAPAGRGRGQRLQDLFHHEGHRGDRGIAVESRGTLEPMRDDHERRDELGGGSLTRGETAHAFLDRGHSFPGLHQEDAEDELVVLVFEHEASVSDHEWGQGHVIRRA